MKSARPLVAIGVVILGLIGVGIAVRPSHGPLFGLGSGTVRVVVTASCSHTPCSGTTTYSVLVNPSGSGATPTAGTGVVIAYGTATLCTISTLTTSGVNNGIGSCTATDPGLANDYTVSAAYPGDTNYAAHTGYLSGGVTMSTTATTGAKGWTYAGSSATYSVTASTDSGLPFWTSDQVTFGDQTTNAASTTLCNVTAFSSTSSSPQTKTCSASAPAWPQGVLPAYNPKNCSTGTITLSSGLTAGTPITSIPVNALTSSASECLITLTNNSNSQVFAMTSAVSSGATSIPVASQAPIVNFNASGGNVTTVTDGSPLSQDAPADGGLTLAPLLAYPSSCYGDPATNSEDGQTAIQSLVTGDVWNGGGNCFVTVNGIEATNSGTCSLGDEPTIGGADDISMVDATIYDQQTTSYPGTINSTIVEHGSNCWAFANLTLDGANVYSANTNQSQSLADSGMTLNNGTDDTYMQNIVSNEAWLDGLTMDVPGQERYLWINGYISYNPGRDGFVPAALHDAIINNMTIITPSTDAIDAESDLSNVGVGGVVMNNLRTMKALNYIEPLNIPADADPTLGFGGDGPNAPNALTFNGFYGIVGGAGGGTYVPSASTAYPTWINFNSGFCLSTFPPSMATRIDGQCPVYIGPATVSAPALNWTSPADGSPGAGTYQFPAITVGERSLMYQFNTNSDTALTLKGAPFTIEDTDIERALPDTGSTTNVWKISGTARVLFQNSTYIPPSTGPPGTITDNSTLTILP